MISSCTYTGPHIPRPEQPRVHINLWYFGSPPASPQEVIISEFSFVPEGNVNIDEHLYPVHYQALQQNYPNPFYRNTEIAFKLNSAETVSLEVFDIKGRKIAKLLQERKAAGSHTLNWDAESLPAGIYILRLTGNSFTETRRMLLLK